MKDKQIVLTTLAPKSHRTSEENLGLGYLKSSLEQAGFKTIIIDGWLGNLSGDEVYQKIQAMNDVLFVGISSYMTNTKPSVELMQRIKANRDIKVLCGGFGPTFYSEDYIKAGADFVLRGEGEQAIVDLAKAIHEQKGLSQVRGLTYKDGEKIVHNENTKLLNLDQYPFPSRDTMDMVLDKKSTVNMVTSRGCTGDCEFCSVVSFFRKCEGKKWRTRSIENIVDEIEQLAQQGVSHIKIVDDSFVDGIRDANWCKEFADEILKRNINVKLRGQIRADKVTEDILYHLKRAGFYSFACGIENGSSAALSRMNKMATLEDNERALNLFKQYNIIVQMGFILFDKDTTLEELWENYEFLQKYIFAVTKGIFSEMYSAEGTKLNTRLKATRELLEGDFLDGNNKYFLGNNDVEFVYNNLKRWQKSHSYIYDMIIDPLSAPKTISDHSRQELLELALSLKKMDLQIFRNVLLATKGSFDVEQEIKETQDFYQEQYQTVAKVYRKERLQYNADLNPFI